MISGTMPIYNGRGATEYHESIFSRPIAEPFGGAVFVGMRIADELYA